MRITPTPNCPFEFLARHLQYESQGCTKYVSLVVGLAAKHRSGSQLLTMPQLTESANPWVSIRPSQPF